MPVDPSDGEALAARVLPVVAQAEAALLRIIAQAIGDDRDGSGGLDGPDDPAATAEWARVKLERLRFLAAQVDAGAARMAADLEQLAARLVQDAYDVGAGLALIDLDDLPVDAPGAAGVAARTAQAAAGTAAAGAAAGAAATLPLFDLSARWEAVRAVTTRRVVAAYADAVEAGAAEVLTGQVGRRAASQHVLDRLGRDGVKGFTDRAGRSWALESYTEMSVRTVVGQAAVTGHVDTLQAAGLDLVQVSDAPRECPLCRPYEGKVLTLSGATGAVILPSATDGTPTSVRVEATLAEARSAGFQHPNCRHRLVAYLPGVTRPPARRTSDPAGYEAGQRQRAMERKVREWKRREALALDPATAAAARGKARAWQAAIREHVDANDLKRLSAREQIGRAI